MTRFAITEEGAPVSEPGKAGGPASLSVLILARNEADNLDGLLPSVSEVLAGKGIEFEMVVVDASSPDGTAEVAARRGARPVRQVEPGYANALRQGIRECTGDLVLALDADCSHRPEFIADLLDAIDGADVVVASRYVEGGSAEMPAGRRFLSLVLNRIYGTALGLPVRDLSSGFRLYRTSVLREIDARGDHFDVLPEIVALAHFAGRTVREVPFRYSPREAGVSKARVIAFGPSYVRTLARCLRARFRRQ